MILESFDYAEEDFRQRQIIEARNEAENIAGALEKGRSSPAWQQLTNAERKQIGKLEAELKKVSAGEDYRAIRDGIEKLNQATLRLAELMMDTAVSSVLKGRTMEQMAQADVAEGPSAPHPIAPAEIK